MVEKVCFNSSIAYELVQNNHRQVGEEADLDIPIEVGKIPGIYSLEEIVMLKECPIKLVLKLRSDQGKLLRLGQEYLTVCRFGPPVSGPPVRKS